MTDEELNKKVAELAGWKIEKWSGGTRLTRPNGTVVSNYYGQEWKLPQYTQSRDAIIGLVEGLDDRDIEPFYENLIDLVGIPKSGVETDRQMLNLLTAPARDLCLAYVKVMEEKG